MTARLARRAVLTFAGIMSLGSVGLSTMNARAADSAIPDNAADSARTLIGSYLAGRFARTQHDNTRAADFYRNALENSIQRTRSCSSKPS